MKDPYNGCLLALSLPVMVLAGSLLNGWCVRTLWAWFVTPLGVNALSLSQAIGFYLIVRVLTYQKTPDEKSDRTPEQAFVVAVVAMVLQPVLCVAFGWFVLWCAR